MNYSICFVLLLCASLGQSTPREKLTANINKYLDVTLVAVEEFLTKKGLDPFKLEDIVKSFSVDLGLIHPHGELSLKNGWLKGISHILRNGDCVMNYEAQMLNLRINLLFEELLANFDYKAEIIDLGPSGTLEASIKDIRIYVDINVDTMSFEIILQEFTISDAGKINVKFGGHPIIDWLGNALSKVATTLLHDVVVNVINKEVKGILEQAIIDLNNKIHPKDQYLYLFDMELLM